MNPGGRTPARCNHRAATSWDSFLLHQPEGRSEPCWGAQHKPSGLPVPVTQENSLWKMEMRSKKPQASGRVDTHSQGLMGLRASGQGTLHTQKHHTHPKSSLFSPPPHFLSDNSVFNVLVALPMFGLSFCTRRVLSGQGPYLFNCPLHFQSSAQHLAFVRVNSTRRREE